ncbi:TonB-dependent receptor [candidate division KSB1 bacterium]|nr:TonB-dependent receptor [candidate division KSB1 bacterium]
MIFRCTAWLLILFGIALSAETQKPDSVRYHFNPVVVTATKIAGAQKDLAASISVISAETIRRTPQVSSLELVRDRVPGLFLTEKNVMGYGVASGAAGGITIRGVGSTPVTGVLVLRDGRPDMMGLMGHAIPDAYPLDGIERIEVVRGPASFLYGTNAMGGVINLVSQKHRQKGFITRLDGRYGTYAQQRLRLSHGGNTGRFDYQLSIAQNQTDGHRPNSAYESTVATLHSGLKISPHFHAEINANWSDILMNDPGTRSNPDADHWYDLVRSGLDITLIHSGSTGETTLKAHGNFGRHKIYDGFRSTDQTVGAMLYHTAALWPGQKTTLGLDVKNYGGEITSQSPGYRFGSFDVTEFAPYLHVQQMFWERLILSGALRVEEHELSGREWIPGLGLVWHLDDQTSIRLQNSKGFRSPTIRELYLFPPRNPDLEPERLWNREIGISRMVRDCARLDLALFHARGSDLIRLQGLYMTGQWINSADFVHTGYEITAEWIPIDVLEIHATWSKHDLGDETLNAPGKKLGLGVVARVGLLELMAQTLVVQDLYGGDRRTQPMADYQVTDLSLALPLFSCFRLQMSLKNAFNADYETLPGYPMPRRTLVIDGGIRF